MDGTSRKIEGSSPGEPLYQTDRVNTSVTHKRDGGAGKFTIGPVEAILMDAVFIIKPAYSTRVQNHRFIYNSKFDIG